jgi:uncharacterized protein (TIGR02246 family)
MKKTILILTMIILGCGFVFGQSKAEQEIRDTLGKIAEALTRNDADQLANYWTDDHIFINQNGTIITKAERIANLKNAQPRPGVFKYEDIRVRMLGNNAAVVTLRATYPIKFANGQIVTVSDRAASTMIKTNGRWQIVVTQSAYENPSTGDAAAVEKQLNEILTNWGAAIGRRDVAAIEKILPPNQFLVHTPDGRTLNREQYLEGLKNLTGEAVYTGNQEKVTVQGDTAVSMGTVTVTPKGGQSSTFKYTATFVRRAGRWFPVSFYADAQN